MIVKELTRTTQLTSIGSHLREKVENIFKDHKPSFPVPVVSNPSNKTIAKLDRTWGKIQYSRWIETVKQTFKKGDYVTYKRFPNVLGHCPLPYYVVDIEEMHFYAELDKERDVPKALAVALVGSSTPTYKTPDELRKLTSDEIAVMQKDWAQTIITNDSPRTNEEFPEPEQLLRNPNAV